MKAALVFFLTCIISFNYLYPQQISIVESTDEFIIFNVRFNSLYRLTDTIVDKRTFNYFIDDISSKLGESGAPGLPFHSILIGLPGESTAKITVLKK